MTTVSRPAPPPVPQTVKKVMHRQTSWRRHAMPVTGFLLRLGVFLLFFGGSAYGIHHLWTRAMHDPRFRMDGETLALAGAVRECPESVGELERLGRQFEGRSLLDPMLISDMEEAYGGSLWIRKLTRMRRMFPNRVEVEFLLRMPAAQVWQDGRYWMIDKDAALLPVAGSPAPFAHLPEIVGVTARDIAGRPAPGGTWGDEGVTGALGIMRSFWGSPLGESLPVAKIVVSTGVFRDASSRPQEARRRFEVVTDSGVIVRWGTFNPGNLAGELTSSEKLWQLQELLLRDEALRPGVCFDVRTRLPGYTLAE